ncbi:MAG: hypothetical protein ABIR18_10380 [Chitinophagaceae bacterium]
MKTGLFTVACVLFFLSSFGQYDADRRDAYLKRSKDQRLAGYITLGCGVATLLPGLLILNQTEPGLENLDRSLSGAALALLGAGCMGASLILFVSANQNQRKADKITLQLNKPVVINTGLLRRVLPYSIGLAITMN